MQIDFSQNFIMINEFKFILIFDEISFCRFYLALNLDTLSHCALDLNGLFIRRSKNNFI